LATFALSGCDLFNSNDNETPTSPLLANVVQVGSTNVQANAAGFAEYLGQVVNTGSVTARNVRVSVNIFDDANNLIDVASSIAVPADLAPQQTATFKVTSSTALAQAITFQIVIEFD
jgi:hypothetical protein|tara:strand:+ start:149 stop:499 length:351 start_codon:yes stop_codon:yes gene_type:complete